jgi:hypothetical protein
MARFLKCLHRSLIIAAVLSATCLAAAPATAQDAAQTDAATPEIPKVPEIADEPRTVDPATLVPEAVAKPVTLKFQETMLRDVATAMEDQTGVPVVFDAQALADQGVLLSDPVTDQLSDEPLYLLLNRLRSLGLGWRLQANVLRITTLDESSEQMRTEPYNIGDLVDAGYEAVSVTDAIELAPQTQWEDIDGAGGSVEMLGDVVFVRQTDDGHRQIAGLLTALRKHARRTFALDPPQHGALRQKLNENISVTLKGVPLQSAVARLAELSGADIRLDVATLKTVGVREREPVSLALNDRSLRTVVELLLAKLKLTWILRDGVLWITSPEAAEENLLAALYDVRDLCRNSNESDSLANAVQGQTSGMWEDIDGAGGEIAFPLPGTMLVVQTEQMHGEVLSLLGAYRQALLASKVRKRADPDDEVTDHYYQMQQPVAEVLADGLKMLIAPESWRSEERPDAPGTILLLPSNVTATTLPGVPTGVDQKVGSSIVVVPQSVLIIHQTRKNHEKISTLIRRIQNGDPPITFGGGGGLGGGGGGFGGGYFSIKPGRTPEPINR